MTDRAREILIVSALLLIAALVFTLGISWGLPSRKTDAYLFGDRTPWSGAEILALAPQRNGSAADVDVNPASRGSVVNDTDAKRAEIVRRYRLFTYQPDEMITLMALAGMHPSQLDFDPRLYQYGGLWIYPVGGLIKLLLHPKNDQAYYLDHPEAFGQFYIVARAYSAAWGVVGAWAVYALMRRLSRRAAIFATLLNITMPVVVNMAHEAKPHLAGTVLMLLAAVAARSYIDLGGWRRLVLTSALCGAAAGMILSAIVAPIIAIVAILLRARKTVLPLPVRGERAGERAGTRDGSSLTDAIGPRGTPLPLSLSPGYREEGGVGPVTYTPNLYTEGAPHPSPLLRVRGRGDQSWAGHVAVRVIATTCIAIAVYGITNPYVIKHLLFDRAVLMQNLGNSKAMYHADLWAGITRAIVLIAAGGGWLTLIGGVVGGTLFLARWGKYLAASAARRADAIYSAPSVSVVAVERPEEATNVEASANAVSAAQRANATRSDAINLVSTLLPLMVVSAVVAVQFAALAAGKPGEYARFALVIDVTLAIIVVAYLAPSVNKVRSLAILCVYLCANCAYLVHFERNFWLDSRNTTRRDQLAATLRQVRLARGLNTIGVVDEPAPYLLPPIDLWNWRITLLPHDAMVPNVPAQVFVRPVDRPVLHTDSDTLYEDLSGFELGELLPTTISWADKHIEVWAQRKPTSASTTR